MKSTTSTYQVGLVEIVVHRPTLEDKERQKREATLKRTIAAYGKSLMKQRKE